MALSKSNLSTAPYYKHIFVDWDGTLSNSRFWEHWKTDAAKRADYDLIQTRFFDATPELMVSWMRGELTYKDVVDIIAARTGLDPRELSLDLRHSCERMQLIDEQLLQQLQQLRDTGATVIIATDNMDTFELWTAPALQLNAYCDDILNSHSLKSLKRDKNVDGSSPFFADYLQRHAISPETSILVDDRDTNKIVLDFGIHFTHVNDAYPTTAILAKLYTHNHHATAA